MHVLQLQEPLKFEVMQNIFFRFEWEGKIENDKELLLVSYFKVFSPYMHVVYIL